jgi:signal recognition particle GTPase
LTEWNIDLTILNKVQTVGTGQGYDDLQSFDSEKFIEKLEEEPIGA